MTPKKPREANPGELREINVLESLEKLSRRPETRIDLQRYFDNLSPNTKTYAKHLVSSGPSSIEAASKACGLSPEEVEAALADLEQGIIKLRKS